MSYILTFILDYTTIRDRKLISSLSVAKLRFQYNIDSIESDVMMGKVIFIADGVDFALSCSLIDFEKRPISEPQTEKNVRGAHEGFVEVAYTNISILRRKVRNNNLKFKKLKLGSATNQSIYIAYINKIANPEILGDLVSRVESINFDGILGSGYIEQMVADSPNSPFPQFMATERPDKVIAQLLEGRFAVIVDGTPVVIVAPVYDMGFAIRFYRFVVMIASSAYGAIGILVCGVLLVSHLLSLESLGQPYFQPLAPFKLKDMKDVFIRMPFKYMKQRPADAKPLDTESMIFLYLIAISGVVFRLFAEFVKITILIGEVFMTWLSLM